MRKTLWVFLVIALLASCVKLHESGIPSPIPIEPKDGEILDSSSPVTLSWKVNSPFSGWIYEVLLEIPGKGLITEKKTSSTSLTLDGLEEGLYSWRVRLVSPEGRTQESERRSFYLGGPGRVSLTFPVGGIVQPGEVNFSWKTESELGIDHFSLILNGTSFDTAEPSATLFLEPKTSYRWRVRVYMKNGAYQDSDYAEFETSAVETDLVEPENESEDLHPDRITLRWSSQYPGPFLVHLFKNGNPIGTWSAESQSFDPGNLDYDTEYSWYVSLLHEDDGKSETWTFKTLRPNPPTISPESPSEPLPPDAILSWDYNDENFDPVRFRIFVGYDPEYTHTVTLEGKSISISRLVEMIGEPLESGKDIYWAVQAVDSLGRTTPKAPGIFRLIPIELLSPSDGQTDLDPNDIVLSWKGDPNYETYQVHIEGGGKSFVFNTTQTKYVVSGLDYNTTYLWYVVADGKFKSEVRSFKTTGNYPIELLGPSDGETDLDPDNVVLSWKGDPNYETYEVHVEGGGTELVFTTTQTKYVVSGLDYNTTYLWHVVADGKFRSEVRSFETHVVDPPRVVNPSDGQVDVDPSDFIMWMFSDDLFDLDHYIFWFGKDPTLEESTTLKGESISIEDAAEIFDITLSGSDVIYWAVQAVDSLGRKSGVRYASFRLK